MVHAAISRSFTKAYLTKHVSTKTERRYGALPPTILTRKPCGVSADDAADCITSQSVHLYRYFGCALAVCEGMRIWFAANMAVNARQTVFWLQLPIDDGTTQTK